MRIVELVNGGDAKRGNVQCPLNTAIRGRFAQAVAHVALAYAHFLDSVINLARPYTVDPVSCFLLLTCSSDCAQTCNNF